MTHRHWRHMVNRSKKSDSDKPGWLNESNRMSLKNGDSAAMGARVWIFNAPVQGIQVLLWVSASITYDCLLVEACWDMYVSWGEELSF